MTDETSQRTGSASRTERVYAEYLATADPRSDAGPEVVDDPRFEEHCLAHADIADELRTLHSDWCRLQSLLPRSRSIADVLQRFGVDVDLVGTEDATEENADLRLEGQSGDLLEIRDPDLGRTLELKVGPLGDEVAASGPEAREVTRFLEEAQVTAQLEHPGIAPVHELGVDERGRLYFTMRRVRGRDLTQIVTLVGVAADGWTLARGIETCIRVCDTLAYAHARGVVHRDVRPENIRVGDHGAVYVTGWGLARVEGREDVRDLRLEKTNFIALSEIRSVRKGAKGTEPSAIFTLDGTSVGTPYFLPPEQAESGGEPVGPTADVYGIGALLYLLLTGRAPYSKEGESPAAHTVLSRVLSGPPKRIRELAPEAPPELVSIAERAMAREVERRHASAAELGEDLRGWLAGSPVTVYEEEPELGLATWLGGHRVAVVAIAAVVVLVAAWVGLGGGDDPLEPDPSQPGASSRKSPGARVENAPRAERAEPEGLVRLAEAKRVEALARAAREELWPPIPQRIAALEGWLTEMKKLEGRRDQHVATLGAMRAAARPWSDDDRAADRDIELRRRVARVHELGEHLRVLNLGRSSLLEDELLDPRWEKLGPAEHAERHRAEYEDLFSESFEVPRRTYRFDDAELEGRQVHISELVDDIAELLEGGLVTDVEERLAVARELDERSRFGPEAQALWSEAIASIQNEAECPMYGGLQLEPQLGLLPVGRDPDSGLWEFAHLISGVAPERDPGTGRLDRSPGGAIVMVLLPSAAFMQGAQRSDPNAPNHDPQAMDDEGPVQRVELAPFFVSKFELTQPQWRRAAGSDPSACYARGLDPVVEVDLHPVESVTWYEARDVLARWDLTLPTEAQWEFACRAGSDTAWYMGAEPTDLAGYEVLGVPTHAPIAARAPNAFGLFDMLGNVAEWCRDGDPGTALERVGEPRPVDGERIHGFAAMRVVRGGSYVTKEPSGARCASRWSRNPEVAEAWTGVRAVRAVR